MNAFNRISSALFDLVLDLPPGDQHAWFDLIVWPVLGGIVALLVYKYTSNQAGITHAKGQIKMRLVEIRLFSPQNLGEHLSSSLPAKIFLVY